MTKLTTNNLPQTKTVNAKFERLVITAKNSPARLSRACEQIAKLGKRTGNEALIHLANALNEQRHVVLQARLENVKELAYHCSAREAQLAAARRYIARNLA